MGIVGYYLAAASANSGLLSHTTSPDADQSVGLSGCAQSYSELATKGSMLAKH